MKILQETNETLKEVLREIKWSNKALIYVIITNVLIVITIIVSLT